MTKRHKDARWLGLRIAAARRFRGWELDELAARASVSPRRLGRCEATGELTCDELEQLAAALRLPVTHFLGPCALCLCEAAPAGEAHPATSPPGHAEPVA